jgi:hypothetical protein
MLAGLSNLAAGFHARDVAAEPCGNAIDYLHARSVDEGRFFIRRIRRSARPPIATLAGGA